MGLFVTEDGHFQGWLATLLCCFAAVNDDESPLEQQRERAPARPQMYQEQPTPLSPMSPLASVWTLNAFKGDHSGVDGTRQTIRVSQYPPSLRPLDLGDLSLFRPWPTDSNIPGSVGPVGTPTTLLNSHTRYDHHQGHRPALVPLRLGPVVLRDLPSIESEETMDVNAKEGHLTESLEALLMDSPNVPSVQTHTQKGMKLQIQTNIPSSLSISRRLSFGSLKRQDSGTPTSSIKSSPSSGRAYLRRQRSLPANRKEGEERLEKEILELNTIVEERRTEQALDSSSTQHIAAVAPSMNIAARSETLNDIGSVLSRSVTQPRLNSRHGPNRSSYPDRPYLSKSFSAGTWRKSRLSGWLSEILPTPTTALVETRESFYKCRTPQRPRRTYSDGSVFGGSVDSTAPSLTMASSPTSKGHSRNLTDESRTIPHSPSTLRSNGEFMTNDLKEKEGEWTIGVASINEVGVAF